MADHPGTPRIRNAAAVAALVAASVVGGGIVTSLRIGSTTITSEMAANLAALSDTYAKGSSGTLGASATTWDIPVNSETFGDFELFIAGKNRTADANTISLRIDGSSANLSRALWYVDTIGTASQGAISQASAALLVSEAANGAGWWTRITVRNVRAARAMPLIFEIEKGASVATASGTSTWSMGVYSLVDATKLSNAISSIGIGGSVADGLASDTTYTIRPLSTGNLPYMTGDGPPPYTVLYTDAAFRAASTTASITLTSLLSSRQKLCGLVMDPQTSFAGTGVSTMTCTIGSATGGNSAIYAPALSVMQNTESYSVGGLFSGRDLATPDADLDVVLTCTANTNFGNGAATVLTAGKLWINVCKTNLPAGT